MSATMERMTSTSNSQSAATDGSSAEKKRNKLGYHRTSVACVHCRRRKIRCLVAQDDAQGRCQNCIRLRKECQYLSVDQQPPAEKKSQPSSRVGSASEELSTASLPPSTISGAADRRETFFPYPAMPLTSNQEVPGTGAGAFAGNPIPPFPQDRNIGPPDFAAHPPLDPSVPWDEFTTISDPQALAAMKPTMMNLSPNVWSPGGTPIAPMPSNPPAPGAPSVRPQPQAVNAGGGFAMHPGSMWPVQPSPSPSMAFPTQPEMTGPYPAQFPHGLPSGMKEPGMAGADQGHPGGGGPPVRAQAPLGTNLQGSPMPVSYPGQPPTMDFPAHQDQGTVPPFNVVAHPMFSGGANQPNFGQLPMNYPGQGRRTSRR